MEVPFTEEEIKLVVCDSYAMGAPGPGSFSFMFYQTFWEVIKGGSMHFVRDFEAGKLNLWIGLACCDYVDS